MEGRFVKSSNSTFLVLVLILVKGGVKDLRDFRQISQVMRKWSLSPRMLLWRVDRFWMQS